MWGTHAETTVDDLPSTGPMNYISLLYLITTANIPILTVSTGGGKEHLAELIM